MATSPNDSDEREAPFASPYFVVYWTLVFGITSWFEHATWPWGLVVIPFAAANVYARRKFLERHPEAEGHV